MVAVRLGHCGYEVMVTVQVWYITIVVDEAEQVQNSLEDQHSGYTWEIFFIKVRMRDLQAGGLEGQSLW